MLWTSKTAASMFKPLLHGGQTHPEYVLIGAPSKLQTGNLEEPGVSAGGGGVMATKTFPGGPMAPAPTSPVTQAQQAPWQEGWYPAESRQK